MVATAVEFGVPSFCVKLTSCRVPLACLLVLFSSAGALAQSTITLDGAQGANPSSPAAGKFVVTGAYTIAPNDATYRYALNTIKVKYRRQGDPDPGWIAVDAVIDETNKTWSKTVAGLATGTYEVHAVLFVTRSKILFPFTVTELEYPTETRTVFVP